MARKQFVVVYPDRSREHIGRTERDQLLLSGDIRQLVGNEYRYTGQVQSFHSFADLSQLQDRFQPTVELRRFLEGRFTVELKGKRHSERLETPGAMWERLDRTGQLAGCI